MRNTFFFIRRTLFAMSYFMIGQAFYTWSFQMINPANWTPDWRLWALIISVGYGLISLVIHKMK